MPGTWAHTAGQLEPNKGRSVSGLRQQPPPPHASQVSSLVCTGGQLLLAASVRLCHVEPASDRRWLDTRSGTNAARNVERDLETVRRERHDSKVSLLPQPRSDMVPRRFQHCINHCQPVSVTGSHSSSMPVICVRSAASRCGNSLTMAMSMGAGGSIAQVGCSTNIMLR